MVNSKHSFKFKSTPKIGVRSSSKNINDSKTTPTISGTNEDEYFFKETVKKIYMKKTMKENHSSTSLENFKIHKSNIKELQLTLDILNTRYLELFGIWNKCLGPLANYY